MAEPTALSLCSLPSDIYDFLSDFLDDDSLFVLLTLSRHITVASYLLQRRMWRQKSIEYWAGEGDLKAVKYLYGIRRSAAAAAIDPSNFMTAINWASTIGDLAMVKYLHTVIGTKCINYAMDTASAHGHLDLVKYLHSIGTRGTTYAMDGASETGQLAVLQFLHSIGATCTADAMSCASRNGHLAVVQYLHGIGAPCTKRALTLARKNGHVDVVGFLKLIFDLV